MSNTGKFRVSFHVSHPTMASEDIVCQFSWRPKYARSVGRVRQTKSNVALEGVYKRTDVNFSVEDQVLDNDMIMLADYIDQSLSELPVDFLRLVVSTGGSCFFLVGIYSSTNILCDFDVNVLSRLVELGVGLKLDFYGGEGD